MIISSKQRWCWVYKGGNIYSETICEVLNVEHGFARVECVAVIKSNMTETIGQVYAVELYRFSTPEFIYLDGQDRP